ncbi:S-adenosyl-L-methionine-dependent methyltransferase [Rozella allomycis CSF55]|uniref:S-adenosyl-L-methionine-dependent methyltransferase n=1 Tax=Rozella allomycis (strain CSF55) TaxID=988480 RepID=A0A4P9YN70_ROZAC|nr:S-adenosyl-L-methionine-dependent methyltransferase [Rozella allomycis CSF55]
MIPPLFLDLKPEHRVLDMCASPGSKTTQILQLMHQQCPEGFPDGMVVANDADHKRAYLLVHQAKRMLSPMLLVTNHDGTQFPTLNDNDKNPILFDRVLCDVPCSGDGTLRKNMAMWRKWTPSVGIGLHPLQLRLLQRGCELTRIGGRIVYSTCSFNPAENEAVVAEILRLYPESLKLLDGFTLKHKDLKARPGLKTWKIMDTQGDVYDSYDQVPSKYVKWKKSIFPPTEEENIPLERCMRFLPHDQNTGGFFVAVFEKIGNMKEICKATEEMKKEKDELKECQEMLNSLESDSKDQGDKCEISNTDAVILEPQRPSNGYREEPFVFLSNQSYLDSVKSFYGFSESFPFSNFVIRNDKVYCIPNSIYFVSNKVREYLESRQAKKLCVINTGVKTFSRHDGPADDVRLCPFRFHREALYSISSFISHRSMKIDMADVC